MNSRAALVTAAAIFFGVAATPVARAQIEPAEEPPEPTAPDADINLQIVLRGVA